MGYIYKVTNKLNGKVYIGQTRRTVSERWGEHVYYSSHKAKYDHSLLHQAIRKYGEDSFTVEELEQCDVDHLDERETFWISHYGSHGNGYNLAIGGKGGQKVSDEIILSLWEQGLTVGEISKILPIHSVTVSKHLQYNGVAMEEIVARGNQKAGRTKSMSVYQYDLHGNFIREFSSLKEAQESIGGQRIKFPPKAKGKQTAGFQWRKFKADKIESIWKPPKPKKEKPVSVKKEKKPPKPKKPKRIINPVYQYTIDGKYIREYASALEAAKTFGLHGSGPILSCCTGRSRYSHGYRWSHEKVDQLPEMRKDRGIRPIVQLDDDFNVIEILPKISDACKKFGVTPGAIVPVCNGQHPKGVGYKWMFLEDYEEVKNERIS